MAGQRRRHTKNVDEVQLRVGAAEDHAAGLKAVTVSAKRSLERTGPARTARTWLKLNQADGFDCMSCAWPDPDPEHRHTAEFCENGAKAVAEEATTRRATPQFFAEHSLAAKRAGITDVPAQSADVGTATRKGPAVEWSRRSASQSRRAGSSWMRCTPANRSGQCVTLA